MWISRRYFNLSLLGSASARLLPALVTRPKLLVLVVLEQLPQDILEILTPELRPGGFHKIMYGGAHFPDCRHLAATFSASSLTTAATGAWPAQHGIVADSWFERSARRAVPAAAESLLATTLCAQIAAAEATRSFVIGMDSTQCGLLSAGSNARQFWFDPTGQFSTLGDVPEWLTAFNKAHPIDDMHGQQWMAIDARAGAPPLRTLTFHPGRPREFVNLFEASPFGQKAQFELLGQLIEEEELGQGETTDFVCLVAGATAKLGYETGAHDPLMKQLILQLDRELETLLNRLVKSTGEHGFNLVVSGAHGAPPAPTIETRSRMAVSGESVAQAVNRALTSAGDGRVLRYLYPFLYLDVTPGRDPEAVRISAGRAALEHPAVAGYFTAGGRCSAQNGWEDRFRNSFHPTRSGDVMLSYRPEYVEDFGQGRGISYGSLYNYDARVPLCFYGPQFRTGVFEAPVEAVDLAPTLARAMGVAMPSSAIGRVLGEAFA
jgi:hypothetical protein